MEKKKLCSQVLPDADIHFTDYAGHDEEVIATALSYVAQILVLLSVVSCLNFLYNTLCVSLSLEIYMSVLYLPAVVQSTSAVPNFPAVLSFPYQGRNLRSALAKVLAALSVFHCCNCIARLQLYLFTCLGFLSIPEE